ncbi:putative F-box protein At3g16210 [Salvia miltiorrhiza]|uniref:putative F-box protein At3g16210 n=1 Tax=Salvia miltiorrhiza TaxID=226208 RepID=UPI0025ABBC2C|nr:putative F-box protein At3g16210 [Salvia miltiorrhiza]
MKQSDLLTNLPSDIIIDILSRLPIPTIIRCKSVCKPWLHLLRSHEFATHHLSTSAPALAVFQYKITSELYDIYEFEDDDQHYKLLTSFMPPCRGMIQGSANGFLVLRDLSLRPHGLSICNPITREYMEIHSPPEFDYTYPQVAAFGFGASRITGQHKVVRVFHGREIPECHVYTLGTGSWRSVASSAPLRYGNGSIGEFLNGNLHWLVFDSNGKPWISCFDLETELFSIISPPLPLRTQRWPVAGVFAFQDKLCVCDNSSEDEIVV